MKKSITVVTIILSFAFDVIAAVICLIVILIKHWSYKVIRSSTLFEKPAEWQGNERLLCGTLWIMSLQDAWDSVDANKVHVKKIINFEEHQFYTSDNASSAFLHCSFSTSFHDISRQTKVSLMVSDQFLRSFPLPSSSFSSSRSLQNCRRSVSLFYPIHAKILPHPLQFSLCDEVFFIFLWGLPSSNRFLLFWHGWKSDCI